MRDSSLRLSQIVTMEEIKDRRLSQMHKLNNSLKRSVAHNEYSPAKPQQYYECRLPQVAFGRKDLSLVLRYLFFKQEMNIADRNLLRRILIASFDEETICAGSKKFIHFLRLFEGRGRFQSADVNYLYFLLKGKGKVVSGNYNYQVHNGSIFGDAEILARQKISCIDFESSYLLLGLREPEFNLFFRDYFINRYCYRASCLEGINDAYLSKVSELAKYLLLNSAHQKSYARGQIIASQEQEVKNIYFFSLKGNNQGKKSQSFCLGLIEVLKGIQNYFQTVQCNEKTLSVTAVSVTDFRSYVLNSLGAEAMNEQSFLDLNKSYISLGPHQIVLQERPKLSSFMRKKRVKISLGKSRLKTDPPEYFQTNFKFLRFSQKNSIIHSKKSIENSLFKSRFKLRSESLIEKRIQ